VTHAATPQPGLRRQLNLFQVSVAGIGTILGAGIYALIGVAASESGSMVWLSFIFAAIAAAFTGLTYAELSSAFPRAGAGYEYARQGFGIHAAFVTGWLTVTGGIVASAAVSLGFGNYLEDLTGLNNVIAALLLLGVGAGIAASGILGSVWIVAVLTVVEAGGLVLVTAIGLVDFDPGHFERDAGVLSILSGTALVYFAYMGFEDMASLSEEAKRPEWTVPRAIVIALIGTTLIYVAVAVSAVGAVGAGALAASGAPLALVAESVFGRRTGDVLSLIALAATANTTIILLMSACRHIYAMAETGTLPPFLGALSAETRVPIRALLAVAAVAGGIALWGDLGAVADMTNFILFSAFTMVNAAAIAVRWRRPDVRSPFRTPGSIPLPGGRRAPLIPVLGLATIAVLAIRLDAVSIAGGAGIVVLGVIVAYLYRARHSEGHAAALARNR
jgi:APA family basic amino acid/polyamine antiporter